MATAAQAVLMCQFCTSETNTAKWSCIECSLFLCDKCNIDIHEKVKIAKQHKIVAIRTTDILQNSLDQIPCNIHRNQLCCIFCFSCDELICPKCLLESHKDHILKEIKEIYFEKKSKIESLAEKLRNDLKGRISEKKDNLKKVASLKNQAFKEAHEKITQEDDFISKMKQCSFELLEKVKQESEEIGKHYDSNSKIIDNFEKNVSGRILDAENAIQSGNVEKVFSQVKLLGQDNAYSKPMLKLQQSKICFVKGHKNEFDSKNVFGSLAEIEVIKSYKTDFPVVQKIVPEGSDLWISCSKDETQILKKTNIGEDLHTITNITNIEIYDMAAAKNSDIILNLKKTNKLEILSSATGERQVFFEFVDMRPLGIHVTSTDEVLVGVREITNKNYELTKNSKRQILVLSLEGVQKYVYEYDINNKRLFTYIWRITSTKEGDICVIDQLSCHYTGNVLMINREDQLKWTYTGNLRSKVFRPIDIVATNVGNIIVSDIDNHYLHILSGVDGVLLTHVVTTGIDIVLPGSLVIDNKNTLWVGCSRFKGHADGAEMHALSFSGF
ncbi:Hypothetical predicted protein [Mytilus galloprovincialis]|uniref:B box-type domain-containing protein n=1 Tax=Mytilus galloprovincialis TaxID=29158 RepID=A0A8B6H657_MYTGA|nr:Hypothetical predicted protein [Mytilus galloprovincialis]